MKAERRLAKVEAGLPPKAAVLHWLADAHEHGSLEAYVGSVIDGPGLSPLVALVERVSAAAREARRHEPRPVVREAEQQAVVETVFLMQLILELEREAAEAIRVGGLRLEALRWELRARTAEGPADRRGWTAWRAAVIDLASDVARGEAVRHTVLESHLEGREALFPSTRAAWLVLGDGVATLVEAMATVAGTRRKRSAAVDAIAVAHRRMAPEAVAGLAERVQVLTLDLLGDDAAAVAMVERVQRRCV